MTSSLGWLSPARRAWPLVGLALTLAACEAPVAPQGPEGPQGPPGDPGIQGIDGPTGSQGFATLIDAVDVDRGGECPYGGTRYDMGLDNGDGGGVARDGILQPGEVDESNFVCDAPGAVTGWEVPAGPAGTATIDAHGGTGVNAGGSGGTVQAFVEMSGGPVQGYSTGTVDTSFTMVTFAPDFGDEELTIPNGQTVTVLMVAQGADPTTEGAVFSFQNSGTYRNDHLYVRRGGVSYAITGLRIDAGGTLIVPPDTYRGASILIFDRDIHNAGTISSSLNGSNRYWLLLGAMHYYGDATGRFDLTGVNGGGATLGGLGGSLLLSLSESPDSLSSDHYSNSLSETSCPNWYGSGPGGFYNQGTIDITPGTMGTAQSAITARTIAVCASDEIQNSGTLTATSRGSGTGGNIYLTSGEGGTQNSGLLFAEGGPGFGLSGATGGQVRLQGAFIDNSGTVEADGSSVPATANCSSLCLGGAGGTFNNEAWGGPIRLSGDVHVSGGDAFGSGGTLANAGNGGFVYASSYDGYDDMLDAYVPADDIEVTGNIDISGGDGGGTGGQGGVVGLRLLGGQGVNAYGQSSSLFGYALIDVSGGNGKPGGSGGDYTLANGLGYWELINCCGGSPPSTGTSGAAVNTIHADLTGGDGVGVGANGGDGGEFTLSGRMNYPMPTAQVINRGSIDAYGGAGVRGGWGGDASLRSAGTVENSGAINLSGGAGNTADSTNGYGGGGGNCSMVSQYENLAFTGSCTLNGGSAYYGQPGGFTLLAALETDVSGNVTAPGGNGTTSGGEGGHIEVWSTDSFSVVTGALTSPGGTGTSTVGGGTIVVDGFVWQEQGATP